MPTLEGLAPFHPQIVHFAIVLLVLGVIFRWLALTGRLAFAAPTAVTLLLLGTTASVLAARSGDQAHGPVERIPGARPAVESHEDWGKRTQNVFLAVAAAELVGLVLARRGKARPAWITSGVLGLIGLFCLFEAGSHGGELVYRHAGGVGIQHGDPADVERLLLAGLYQQSLVDRKAARFDDSAALIELAQRRFPANLDVQLLAAESQLLDRKDPASALAALGRLQVPAEQRAARLRHGFLTADALLAQGQKDAARATLQGLKSEYPDHAGLNKRLAELGS